MKHILTLLSILLLSQTTIAQMSNPSGFLWVRGGGSAGNPQTGYEEFKHVGVDKNKNFYGISKVYSSGIKIDTFNKGGYGYDDFVVVSYNCEGQLRWVRHFGSATGDSYRAMTVDDNGNVYLCGDVSTTPFPPFNKAYLADTVINYDPAAPYKRLFIMKLDSLGNRVWLNYPDSGVNGNNLFAVSGMDIDNQGVIHMFTVLNAATINWNGHSPAQLGAHVVKINAITGDVIGMTKLDADVKNNVYDFIQNSEFAMDEDNNYYAVHTLNQDSLYVGGNLIAIDTSEIKQTLIKFSPAGQVLWYKRNDIPDATGKALDYCMVGYIKSANNGIYITYDHFGDTAQLFGTKTYNLLSGIYYRTCPGVMKLNAMSGQPIWSNNLHVANRFGATALPCPMTLLGNGNIAMASFGNDLIMLNDKDTLSSTFGWNTAHPFVVTMDSTIGQFLTGEALENRRADAPLGTLSAVSDGTANGLYAGGQISNKIYSENDSLVSQGGNSDFFVYRYAFPNSCQCSTQVLKVLPQLVSTMSNTVTVKAGTLSGVDSLVWFWGDGQRTKYLSPGSNITHTYPSSGSYYVCLRTYSPCGMTDSCFTVNTTTGIAERNGMDMSVYPNPAKDHINISLHHLHHINEQLIITLMDISGRQVWQKAYTIEQNNFQTMIPVANLPSSIYIMKARIADKQAIRKIMVE